jgi:hypothetical protein
VNHRHKKEKRCKTKGIHNIFNKIIAEIFPNHKKQMLLQDTKHDQDRISPQHIIIKTTSTENKERILKAVDRKIK